MIAHDSGIHLFYNQPEQLLNALGHVLGRLTVEGGTANGLDRR